MTFQPVLPFTGYSGWRFLQRTIEVQQNTFSNDVRIDRTTQYFKDNIASAVTASDLVSDRKLLEVALGAFGLDADIDNRFFIEKILRDGTTDPSALANRLSDKRYRQFADAFGLDGAILPKTTQVGFGQEIVAQYERKQFEIAVGEQDNDLRSALNLSSGLKDIVTSAKSNDARWFTIMGNPPLRAVFEKALGLPSAIARIDLDQQLDNFKSRARATFGTDDVGILSSSEQQENIVRLFLIRSQAAQSAATNSATVALSLLQSIPRRSSLTGLFG